MQPTKRELTGKPANLDRTVSCLAWQSWTPLPVHRLIIDVTIYGQSCRAVSTAVVVAFCTVWSVSLVQWRRSACNVSAILCTVSVAIGHAGLKSTRSVVKYVWLVRPWSGVSVVLRSAWTHTHTYTHTQPSSPPPTSSTKYSFLHAWL